MSDYKELNFWEKSGLLLKQDYADILHFMAADERYALINQLRRLTYSIPLSIVKGCGKNSDKDSANYLANALGSAHEVGYTCFLAFDLGRITNNINSAINEIKATLIAFIKFLRGGI